MQYIYRVDYRRTDDLVSGRVCHRTVIARNADEARTFVAIVDPAYAATVRSPRRGAALTDGVPR